MRYTGFCGSSYTSQSKVASAELSMNWYVEVMESAAAKAQLVMYPTPGTQLFARLSTGPIRGIFENNGRCFAVGGVNLVELLADGTVVERGVIADDGLPVSMCASGGPSNTHTPQLFIVSAGQGYRLRLDDNNLVNVHDEPGGTDFPAGTASMGAFLDGFFIVFVQNSRTFFISGLYTAEVWSALDFTTSSSASDDFISMIVDHGELWLFGKKTIQPYYDSGDADFPFTPNLAARIEQGCIAKNSVCRLDNTIFWLGGDERGAGIVWKAAGYTPVRVSNHAVELAMQGLGDEDLSQVVCYSYQNLGHSFYVMYFPVQKMTWVYDVATNQWHQRGWWNADKATFEAHHSQCHTFAFGEHHLVGDWSSGDIYDMHISYGDDNGNLIRRVRRAPSLFSENKRITMYSLEIFLESGVGLDGEIQGSNPQATLRISRDGGRSFGNELSVSAGKIGETGKRVIFRRLGQGRDIVPEFAVSDPVPWRLIDAFHNSEVGIS